MVDVLHISDERLVALLAEGAVGVLPTDTVYGLVCDAANSRAVARLYALKHREKKPGTMIAAHADQVRAFGFFPDGVHAAERFWPCVSVVLPLGADRAYVHQGLGDIAVRVVASEGVQKLLVQTGPLLTSSANLPSKPPANTITEARAYFGDAVDFYVDGGDRSGQQASTLVRLHKEGAHILRQGSVRVHPYGRV